MSRAERGMGRIFKHVYRDAKTGEWRKTRTWYLSYSVRGKAYFESTGSTDRRVARDRLTKRLEEIRTERFHGPQADRTTFEDLREILLRDYKVNARKSLQTAEGSFNALAQMFAGWRAHAITLDALNRYVVRRQDEGRALATIRNDLAGLKRAFNLARRDGKATPPPFPTLTIRNARKGFFSRDEYERVREALPVEIRPLVTFLYETGWRVGEVLPLTWKQIDFTAGVIRLEPGTTKNDEGRTFPFAASPILAALLREQREATRAIERATDRIIPWVFHRDGRPIKAWRGAWERACRVAGLVGRIPHDFRRTAVRNLERAGVARSVAMKLTGHKTESIYRRYAIVSEGDLAEGVSKLAALQASAVPSAPVVGEVVALPRPQRIGR